jgi:hypothetical protein
MENNDDIEKFIRTHREEMDDAVPAGNIWDRIAQSLPEKASPARSRKGAVIRRISRSGKRWMSAAAVLFIGIFLAAFIRTYQVKTRMADHTIPSDLRDAQTYYENRIESKIREITSLPDRHNNRDTALFHLFGDRDAEYERIRKDLHNNPGNPHVRAAFVEYYRSRLEVLNRIENHLKEQ